MIRISKPRHAATLIAALLLGSAAGTSAYEASRGPSQLVHWDHIKAWIGYTFVKPQRTEGVYLIDMAGQVVNYWPKLTDAYLTEDGTIFGVMGKERGAQRRSFVEVDWDGKVLWQHTETRPGYSTHHDQLRIYNPKLKEFTVLYIANIDMTHEEVIELGGDPESKQRYDGSQMDAIVEVDRRGKVVWEWRFRDHLVQDRDPRKRNYVGKGKTLADHPGRLNINWGVVDKDYIHANGIDYDPKTGHLAISSNRSFEFYIIDHDGTFVAGNPEASIALAAGQQGDFLYRFGNPANYGQGDHPYWSAKDWYHLPYSGHRQIGGNHDIQWIKDGLPGAGNLLLFNNGMSVPRTGAPTRDPQSELLEINPYLDSQGVDRRRYVNPPEAGYTTQLGTGNDASGAPWYPLTRQYSKQIVWAYRPEDAFVSFHGSGLQRLPNGNTLAELARPGRLVEVTSSGETVWEYVNPITASEGPQAILVKSRHENNLAGWSPFRYPANHVALKGKDLSPKGTVVEYEAARKAAN